MAVKLGAPYKSIHEDLYCSSAVALIITSPLAFRNFLSPPFQSIGFGSSSWKPSHEASDDIELNQNMKKDLFLLEVWWDWPISEVGFDAHLFLMIDGTDWVSGYQWTFAKFDGCSGLWFCQLAPMASSFMQCVCFSIFSNVPVRFWEGRAEFLVHIIYLLSLSLYLKFDGLARQLMFLLSSGRECYFSCLINRNIGRPHIMRKCNSVDPILPIIFFFLAHFLFRVFVNKYIWLPFVF